MGHPLGYFPRGASILGQRFGKLVVIDESNWAWPVCACDCGGTKIADRKELRRSGVRSCGCMWVQGSLHTHNESGPKTAEYSTWSAIRSRCLSKSNAAYRYYGGRGIKICERWLVSYENFLADMGRKPGPEYSIDRIDNSGDYTPENCRWATRSEQVRNMRSNVIVTIDGYSCTFIEMTERFKINKQTVRTRLRNGWPIEDAFKLPVRPNVLYRLRLEKPAVVRRRKA